MRCPICNSERTKIQYSLSSDDAARHTLGYKIVDVQLFQKIKSHIETLWNKKYCDFVRCTNCFFSYAIPYVPGDIQFYSLAYHNAGNYVPWKWDYQVTYDEMQDLYNSGNLKKAFTLLEIGSGDGAFIKRVTPTMTKKKNVKCLEYSGYGVQAIRKYGVDAYSQDIREFCLSSFRERFDVICMFQVLEHMDDLDTLFSCLNYLMSKDGHLFITVPNNKQREFFDLHGVKEDIPPIHIARWGKQSFDIMAKRHGYDVKKHKTEPQGFISKTKKLIMSRFIRTKLSTKIDHYQTRFVCRVFKAFFLFPFFLGILPISKSLHSKDLGTSQWIHLVKVRKDS